MHAEIGKDSAGKNTFPDCEEEKKFNVKTFCLGLQYVKMKSMVKLKIF